MSEQKQQKPLCPFKKIIEREYSGHKGSTTTRERFDVCAGARCMAYKEPSTASASASAWSRTGDQGLHRVQVAGPEAPSEMHLLRPESLPEGLLRTGIRAAQRKDGTT